MKSALIADDTDCETSHILDSVSYPQGPGYHRTCPELKTMLTRLPICRNHSLNSKEKRALHSDEDEG
jgi:hypothetical protein